MGRFRPVDLLRLRAAVRDGRQEDAHPHQLFFVGDTLFVIDLGADLVREYAIDLSRPGADVLVETRRTSVPAGCGPRHGVVLPDGRLALSGELGSNLLVGRPGDPAGAWADIRSTLRTGPAKTRHLRNYPGDIQRSPDGRFVFICGRDTASTFDGRPLPALGSGSMPASPGRSIFWRRRIICSRGWDSSAVRAFPLHEGRPSEAVTLFDCPGAGWLTLWD